MYAEPGALEHPAVGAARAAGAPVREVVDGALAKVLDLVAPQSVVAVARQRTVAVEELLARAVADRRPVLVLVELQDPGNVGTLVRVAEGSGCAGIVLTERTVDVHNPKVVRAAAGALFRVPVAEGVEAGALLDACAAAGLATWATERSGGVVLDEADLSGASALLVGSEAHGLPEAVGARVGHRLTIPMAGRVESLNAGVAGALVTFEAARQRRAAGGGERSGVPTAPVGHD